MNYFLSRTGVFAAHLQHAHANGLFNPKRSLGHYAQTCFGMNPTISRHGIAQARLALLIWLNEMVLFGICLPVSRLQWNPIAPSKREHIFSKTEVVIIITLMTDLGLNQ